MAKRKSWGSGVLLALLIGVGAWALFQLVLALLEIPFNYFGLTNPIWINASIVVVILLALVIGWGQGLKTAVKKLVS